MIAASRSRTYSTGTALILDEYWINRWHCLQIEPGAKDVTAKLKEDLKAFMRAGEKQKVGVIKSILSDMTYAAKSPQGMTEGPEGVIQKAIKRRRDSIDAYKSGGREDLATTEQEEINIIERYLPKQMTEAEIEGVVRRVAEKVGAKSAKDVGKVMKEVNDGAHFAPGSATKKAISDSVKKVLTSMG
ncbi:hypothetical protein HK101_008510 [Irineochytrium annulatum]|nr:hypothetical protein HK101_008510 [Irineochytrium annulatum]